MNKAANFQSQSAQAATMEKSELSVFAGLSQEGKNKIAVDLTLLDAIEAGIGKGHEVTTADLCSFMNTPAFDQSVKTYLGYIG